MVTVRIRPFTPGDYPGARALWETSDGIGLSTADAREAIAGFLARNPGLSQVAVDCPANTASDSGGHGETLIGTILVGHDGRRGYIHHLCVAESHRRQNLGRRLVDAGLRALEQAGIAKCHLFVFAGNVAGQAFWTRIGAERRETLEVFSFTL